MTRALVVDDDPAVRESIGDYLADRLGFDVDRLPDGGPALESIAKTAFDIVIADLSMPEVGGVALIEGAKRIRPEMPIIVVSGTGEFQDVVDSMRAGAYDFIRKPIRDLGELEAIISRALERQRLYEENRLLRSQIEERYDFSNMIGESPGIVAALRLASKVSRTHSTVLIRGESGTGKEVLARAIHFNGPRTTKPFVAINCAAIPENLLEAELFGHEKGAFTGADQAKPGRIRSADGGTLFLDEIAEMSPTLQAKLLRVLQEREVEPVGGRTPIAVDVRVLAATHRALEERVKDGTFREDLFYRLNVFPIELPPLRDRHGDVPLLAAGFLKRFASDMGLELPRFSKEALETLVAHSWPGNVRELQNILERAMILVDGDTIYPEHLNLAVAEGPRPNAHTQSGPLQLTLPESGVALEEIERAAILATLERCDHNIAETARRLHIDRGRLRYRLRKYGLGK